MTKKGSAVIPAAEKQLFLLFKSLYPRVQDKNDYGTIIGYTVFNSLKGFHLVTSSDEERIFGEVKEVHSGFERVIEGIKKAGGDYLSPLADLHQTTESELAKIKYQHIPMLRDISKNDFEGSWIYAGILDSLFNRQGYALDKLRRYGLDLDEVVESNGFLKGNRTSLESDYRALSRCFIRQKGDRRE